VYVCVKKNVRAMMMKINKRAEAGIGTLILFIAMILVAAVAAGVLIQTASSLQSKALSTGNKAKTQVSTAVIINSLYATNGSTNQNVEYFFAEMKLAPGSDPIKLSDALAELILKNGSQSMSYNGSTPTTCTNTIAAALATTKFGVQYVIQGANYRAGYLQQGDVILTCFRSSRSVNEDEEFTLTFTPKTGSISQIKATTPEVMTVEKAYLFP
jgi:flagellin-like protein